MATQTQDIILVIDDRDRESIPVLDQINAEGHDFKVLNTPPQSETEQKQVESANAVLCFTPSIEHRTTAWLNQHKSRNPQHLCLCYTNRFRETKRLRFLEAGADDLIDESENDQLLTFIRKNVARDIDKTTSKQPSSKYEKVSLNFENATMHFELEKGEISNVLQFLATTPRHGMLRIVFPDEANKR